MLGKVQNPGTFGGPLHKPVRILIRTEDLFTSLYRMSRNNSKRKSAPARKAGGRNRQLARPRAGGKQAVPASALHYVCGMFDPFCEHALSAKVPSQGAFRSVSANISDFVTLGVKADVTTADNYIAVRYACGLDAGIHSDGVMNNSVVTVMSASDSSYQASLTDISTYRVVCAAVKFRYTGAPISASGFFRIYKLSNGAAGTTIGGHFPDQLSDIGGLYWDYTPMELAKGVTVFLNANTPDAKGFNGAGNATQKSFHEGCALFGVGLDSAATITCELRQTIEFTSLNGTTASLIATPNHPFIPAIEQASSHLAGNLHVATGDTKSVGAQVKAAAGKGLWDTIKYYGSKALDAVPGMIESGFEYILPELEELAMGALALL